MEKQGVRLRPEILRPFLKGTTCYIGATGASVRDIPSHIFADMRRNTVIGINGWIHHDFTPDILIFESYADDYPEDAELAEYRESFVQRQLQYSGVPIIMKDAERSSVPIPGFPKSLYKNIVRSEEYLIVAKSRSEVAGFFDYAKATRRLYRDFENGLMPKRRGTAVYAVVLAYLLGFETVAMLGVDLSNGRHFYDADDKPVSNDEPVHLCESDKIGLPISKVLLGINDSLFEPENKLLCAFRPSELFNGEIGAIE